jgi:hypothetical protein
MKYGDGITERRPRVPLAVFQDRETSVSRAVNALHVQTFIPNPLGRREGTLITFASGDAITVTDDFEDVFAILSGFADG